MSAERVAVPFLLRTVFARSDTDMLLSGHDHVHGRMIHESHGLTTWLAHSPQMHHVLFPWRCLATNPPRGQRPIR